MRNIQRLRGVLLLTGALALVAPVTAMGGEGTSSGQRIVVRATFESYSQKTKTITYSSSKGEYSATWIGVRRYRLRGTITGRRFTGTIRTRQRADGEQYRATGSGRLGGRRVRIGGGGPNNLRSAKLILR